MATEATPPLEIVAVACVPPVPPLNETNGVGSSVGTVHVSVLPLNEQAFPPPFGVMLLLLYVYPNGIESLTLTFVARDGPPFATVTVHAIVWFVGGLPG